MDIFLCPHATPDYVGKRPGVNFDEKLMPDCEYFKPSLEILFNALKAEHITPESANAHVTGDRASDIQSALNIYIVSLHIFKKTEYVTTCSQ